MKYSLSNILAYIQGNIRYKLFYSKYDWLIPGYIKEQINVRIKSMNKECYNSGSCIKCGCTTTQLQMANKPCEGACYPRIVSKSKWVYMQNNYVVIGEKLWTVKHGLFKMIGK